MKTNQEEKYTYGKKFIIALFCVLPIILVFAFLFYRISKNTMNNKIEETSANTVYEMNRQITRIFDDSINIAINLELNSNVQQFFVSERPEEYIDLYYEKIDMLLDIVGSPYVHSAALYSPDFQRVYDSRYGYINMREVTETIYEQNDLKWIEACSTMGKRDKLMIPRKASRGWPYFITLFRKWHTNQSEGYIVINLDIKEIYEALSLNTNSDVYLLDEEDRIVISKETKHFLISYKDIDELDYYSKGKDVILLDVDGKTFVFAQSNLGEYRYKCVMEENVNDYFVKLKELQTQLYLVIGIGTLIACALAYIVVLKFHKPKYENMVLKEELGRNSEMLDDTKLLALQTQINPHFMFNTLNVLKLMIERDCGVDYPASRIISGLAQILRYALSPIAIATVRNEVLNIERYLEIMRYRYGEFEIVIDVDEKTTNYAIPKLVLQPLVENALRHGMSMCMDKRDGKLEIEAKLIEYEFEEGKNVPSMLLSIRDNVIGIDEEQLERLREKITDFTSVSKEHIGLHNVAHRFWLLFKDRQRIELNSSFGAGTEIQIIFQAKSIDR